MPTCVQGVVLMTSRGSVLPNLAEVSAKRPEKLVMKSNNSFMPPHHLFHKQDVTASRCGLILMNAVRMLNYN